MKQLPCPVCLGPDVQFLPSTGNATKADCKRCGRFVYSSSVETNLASLDQKERVVLSGWIYEQSRFGERARITSYNIASLKLLPMPPVETRASTLLTLAVQRQGFLGDNFSFKDLAFLAATYSRDERDLADLAQYLAQEGYLSYGGLSALNSVTVRGFAKAEELASKQTASTQGFVAMWFTPDLHVVYDNGFAKGIEDAGYIPFRIDRSEHVEKIDDEIVAQIKRSRFLVADFTGHRGGVYFEAGFARGREMPVVWTCRKDDLANLHFDIRQFNCIGWETPEDLARRLQNRIEAVIGRGPRST